MMIDQEVKVAAALGSVDQINHSDYRMFMATLNGFASSHGMRTYRDWSKVWEYPWLWLHGLGDLPWWKMDVLDVGSEMSPMPWLMASLGARVHLIESDAQFVPQWVEWRRTLKVDVDWHIVESELLPLPDASVDIVTSFSVIEHQPDKEAAIQDVVRVLRPGGTLAISFDICEAGLGMTFPAWNGRALTIHEFEHWVWSNPAFGERAFPHWNREDVPAFRQWHLQSAPHHNYVVGAALLNKVHSPISEDLPWPDHRGLSAECQAHHGTTCQQVKPGPPADRTSHVSDLVFWCHYNDPSNIGDHVCCPIDFAGLPGVRVDLRQSVADLNGAAFVFGGGGILHGGTVEQIRAIASHGRRRNPRLGLVAWGVGANELGERTFQYPEFLKDFDLVGVRDYGSPWTYVPCPSCLHPVFDHPPQSPQHEFVVYDHYDVPIVGLPSAPRMSNRGDRNELSATVAFLASGEYVITNSFHGAYWGLLLGRKIMVFRPFANRFFGFSRMIEFCDETDWREKMRRCVRYEDYLDECRSINWNFRTKVGAVLQDSLINFHRMLAVIERWEPPVRVQHLTSIRDALTAYHQVHGRYPESTSGWDGRYSNWGHSTPTWINGLVPEYLPELPRDPRNHSDPSQQYLYHSDGQNFKLIAHGAEDSEQVTLHAPDLGDPVRPGWAYGFWTPAGASW